MHLSIICFMILVNFHVTEIVGQYTPGGFTAVLDIKTSHLPDSETKGPIFAVFMGVQGTSKISSLGSFDRGSFVQRQIDLDKNVGELQSVHLFTNSTDGWKLCYLKCELNGKLYLFESPSKWLDAFDLELFRLNGDGYSKEYVRESQDSMLLSVTSKMSSVTF